MKQNDTNKKEMNQRNLCFNYTYKNRINCIILLVSSWSYLPTSNQPINNIPTMAI
jgi:hypothetical protein